MAFICQLCHVSRQHSSRAYNAVSGSLGGILQRTVLSLSGTCSINNAPVGFESKFSLGDVHPRRQMATRAQSHYDILGVTPKASHAQIKAAYYMLSKKYHPDVSDSKDAAKQFALIAEAYNVLGNTSTRHTYDRGFYSSGATTSDVDATYSEFMRRQGKFSGRHAAPRGRTHIYDFDEFYKQHYGESLHRTRSTKQAYEAFRKEQMEARKRNKRNILLYMAMVIGAAAFIALK